MDVPDTVTCIDCGQTAHRLTPPPEEGWQIGDIVAYRCRGCLDRWDLVVADPNEAESQAETAFDFRQWLEERDRGNTE